MDSLMVSTAPTRASETNRVATIAPARRGSLPGWAAAIRRTGCRPADRRIRSSRGSTPMSSTLRRARRDRPAPSAATGGVVANRHAGARAATEVTPRPMSTATAAMVGVSRGVGVTSGYTTRVATSDSGTPTPMPTAVAARPMTVASTRNDPRTCRRVMPMQRASATSTRRWAATIDNVLATSDAATSAATTATARVTVTIPSETAVMARACSTTGSEAARSSRSLGSSARSRAVSPSMSTPGSGVTVMRSTRPSRAEHPGQCVLLHHDVCIGDPRRRDPAATRRAGRFDRRDHDRVDPTGGCLEPDPIADRRSCGGRACPVERHRQRVTVGRRPAGADGPAGRIPAGAEHQAAQRRRPFVLAAARYPHRDRLLVGAVHAQHPVDGRCTVHELVRDRRRLGGPGRAGGDHQGAGGEQRSGRRRGIRRSDQPVELRGQSERAHRERCRQPHGHHGGDDAARSPAGGSQSEAGGRRRAGHRRTVGLHPADAAAVGRSPVDARTLAVGRRCPRRRGAAAYTQVLWISADGAGCRQPKRSASS